MEFKFDKEIDAILRKARESGFAFSENPPTHLDADEISAFAENALPERTKPLYTKHLADCERCRQILSNIILLNSEAETVPAFALLEEKNLAPVTPWYRRLFAFPNLAYSLGALILVFGGLIGFTILQSVGNKELSQASDTGNMPKSSNRAPVTMSNSTTTNTTTIPPNPMMNSNAASVYTANTTTNSAAASNANVSKPSITAPTVARQDDSNSAADEYRQQPTTASPVVPQANSETDKNREESKLDGVSQNSSSASRQTPRDSAKTKKTESESATETLSVSGKTFNRRNNVSYDTAYNNQPTTNITRGSDEYKKLDAGLRQIVERLGGTVVIVWKGKAYRIQ